MSSHGFTPSFTGMVCGAMVMRDGGGDECGLPVSDPIHDACAPAHVRGFSGAGVAADEAVESHHVATARARLQRDYARHQRDMEKARADAAEAALTDLRARVAATAARWQRMGDTAIDEGTRDLLPAAAQSLRGLLEVRS